MRSATFSVHYKYSETGLKSKQGIKETCLLAENLHSLGSKIQVPALNRTFLERENIRSLAVKLEAVCTLPDYCSFFKHLDQIAVSIFSYLRGLEL